MSRKTSNQGDDLAKQDGFSGGKSTTWNPPEPNFSQDYDTAAASAPALLQSGDKRYLDLVRNQGGVVASGNSANKYGFITVDQYSDYGIKTVPGSKYAAVLTSDPGPNGGINIWGVEMISADEFQWSARGSNGGLTDDGPTGYVFREDPRNKQYSIAVYTNAGKIPATKVYEAYNNGLLPKDVAMPFFQYSSAYGVQQAKDQAKAIQDKQAAAAAIAAANGSTAGTTGFGLFTLPGYTPGVGADGVALTGIKRAKELTLPQGPQGQIWYATSQRESGSKEGPHPGVGLAGPVWDLSQLGKPEDNDLPTGVYLLTMDDPDDITSVRPAGKELKIVMQRAVNGDESAIMVLQDLGVPFEESTFGKIEGLLGFL